MPIFKGTDFFQVDLNESSGVQPFLFFQQIDTGRDTSPKVRILITIITITLVDLLDTTYSYIDIYNLHAYLIYIAYSIEEMYTIAKKITEHAEDTKEEC
jgi:hypothetical protein